MVTYDNRSLILLMILLAVAAASLVLLWQTTSGHTMAPALPSADAKPSLLPTEQTRVQDALPGHHTELSAKPGDWQANAFDVTEALMEMRASQSLVGQILANSPKNAFLSSATPQQQFKGRQIMQAVHRVMNWPDHLSMQAVYFEPGQAQPSYTCEIHFKAPLYYREDATGSESYSYITDGHFELSDYWVADGARSAAIVPRDEDSKMFLELFPARLQMDRDLVWLREDVMETQVGNSVERTPVSVVGSWFYDVYVDKQDNLPREVVFYSRLNRSREMVRISNITYQAVEMDDPTAGKKRQSMLPVSYTVDNPWHTRTFTVTLSYPESAATPLDRGLFSLSINRPKP